MSSLDRALAGRRKWTVTGRFMLNVSCTEYDDHGPERVCHDVLRFAFRLCNTPWRGVQNLVPYYRPRRADDESVWVDCRTAQVCDTKLATLRVTML